MKPKIILVFKTHFDIGFTDLAQNVTHAYGSSMLREVIETCRATEHMGPLRYKWTMPAWPLRYIIDHCDPELKPELERLIRNGQIVWHALPFTSHTDVCAPEEYAAALQYAKELSARYGKPYSIAGKMTDVPGHGLMLPELLSRAGIRFLHLGCNEFATPPDVPRLFWWQSPQGGRVLTMYSKGGYGTSLLPPKDWPYPVWMALMHTSDNSGPQTADLIGAMAEKARRACPGTEIVCGTMDDFCRELEQCGLSGVPVVTEDLADTWIHGVGSYPAEVSALRDNRLRARELHRRYAASRLCGGAPIPGWNALWRDYYEQTALFEEHTWGADVKRHLGSNRVYEKEDFLKARSTAPYRFMETSWEEQRDRVRKASAVLEEAEALLQPADREVQKLCTLSYAEKDGRVCVTSPRYQLAFDAATGRIETVVDRFLGKTVLCSHGETGVFGYQYNVAGTEDVQHFLRTYGYRFTDWGILDYGRSQYPECEHRTFAPVFDRYEADEKCIRFFFHNEESAEAYGDSRELALTVSFPEDDSILAELALSGKQASPFIEAGSLILPLPGACAYRLGRPCAVVDPRTQIRHQANHAYFCLEDRVTALGQEAAVTVEPLDTPLLSIGASGLYDYEPDFPDQRPPELWFNLFNNMWGTNFPQWIEGDFRFRFVIRSGAPAALLSGCACRAIQEPAGIPAGLEVVQTTEAEDRLYLLLRDHSGQAGLKTLSFAGCTLCETDLYFRPLGIPEQDRLTLAVRPYGLHGVEIRLTEGEDEA